MLSPLNQESESAAHAFQFAAESEKLMEKESKVPCLHVSSFLFVAESEKKCKRKRVICLCVSSLLFWKSPSPNAFTQAKKQEIHVVEKISLIFDRLGILSRHPACTRFFVLQMIFFSLWSLYESYSPKCVDKFGLLNHLISTSYAPVMPFSVLVREQSHG